MDFSIQYVFLAHNLHGKTSAQILVDRPTKIIRGINNVARVHACFPSASLRAKAARYLGIIAFNRLRNKTLKQNLFSSHFPTFYAFPPVLSTTSTQLKWTYGKTHSISANLGDLTRDTELALVLGEVGGLTEGAFHLERI